MPFRAPVLLAIIFASAIIFTPKSARAADGWGGSLALTSDYILRGVSQSDGSAALQGDVHYGSNAGWSVGIWASTIKLRPTDPTSGETNLFVGFAAPLGTDFSASIQAVHYSYWIDRQIDGYDYDELVARVDYRDSIYWTATYSPDSQNYSPYYGLAKHLTALSSDLQFQRPIFRALSASAGAGIYHLSAPAKIQYWFWNAGLGYTLGPVHLDVSYIGAGDGARYVIDDDAGGRNAAGHHWAATLIWRF